MKYLKPYMFLFGVLLLVFLGCNAGKKEKKKKETETVVSESPNVLIIYIDQLRRYSAGFWSEPAYRDDVVGKPDPVVTPNMDKLAKGGVVFTKANANYPLCSPSRGMMLTGMYPQQNGIWNNCRVGREEDLKADIPAITDVFSDAGYDIGYFGKAHYIKPVPKFDEVGNYVGTEEPPGGHYVNQYDTYVPPGPDRHSIDYFFQDVKDQHYNPFTYSNDPTLINGNTDGEVYRPHEFTPKIESEAIVKYLDNENKERAKNKPFFAIWSINPPHSPWDKKNTDMEELHKHYDTDKYPVVDSLIVRPNADVSVAGRYVRNYFANTTAVDKYIGKVMDHLKKMGVLDNTIIVLSADHGEMLGSQGLENKNVLYTEAMAIPFIVHWPKGIKPGKTDALLGSPDILPTVANLAEIKKFLPKKIEGNDLSDFIENPKTAKSGPDNILLMLGNSRGIKTKRYTLVLKENKKQWDPQEGTKLAKSYLFDNEKDPYQTREIPLKEKPKVAKRLLKDLAAKLKQAHDPWYQHKKYADIIPYANSKK